MSVNYSMIDCGSLDNRRNLAAYIATIRNITNGNLTIATQCESEVCNALWGSGNPDVDGIGMIIGYFFTNILDFLFVLPLVTLLALAPDSPLLAAHVALVQHGKLVLRAGLHAFYDAAIFLCFSIQIASIVVLARLNYGISADMGDTATRLTWSVSLVTLLPLVYAAFMPQLLEEEKELSAIHSPDQSSTWFEEGKQYYPKQGLHFKLFLLCWGLSIYPFMSKMAGYFTPSQVGNGSNAVISAPDWDALPDMCFVGVNRLTVKEGQAVEAFGIIGSLFILILVLLLFVRKIIIRLTLKLPPFCSFKLTPARKSARNILFLIVIPMIAISQFWTIFRLRGLQREMAKTAGNDDLDNDWTFGQIVAVTVFIPVFVETWYAWRHGEE